jgi:hypothetical protein
MNRKHCALPPTAQRQAAPPHESPHLFREALARLERFPLSVLLLTSRIAVGQVGAGEGRELDGDGAALRLDARRESCRKLRRQQLTAPALLFIGFGARFAPPPCSE